MKNKFFKQRSFYAVFLSVVLSVVLVAGAAGAVTTISTNINTGGTLTVSGVTALNGNVDVGDAGTGNNDLVYLYGTTTVIGAQSFIFGSSTETSIAGQVAGSVYYDSTNRLLRLFDGVNWVPVASSTDAGGSLIVSADALVRFNTIATGYMALGTTTGFATDATTFGSVLTLQATTTASVPLTIFGPKAGGGTTNLFEVLSGINNSELFVIDELGYASSTGSFTIAPDIGIAAGSEALFVVGGTATTTALNGNFATQGTLTVTGATTLNGNATLGDAVTDLITINAMATTSASLSIGADSTVSSFLYVGGMATTTATTGNIATQGTLTVGGDVSGTAIDRIFAGICLTQNLASNAITITASSSMYIHCTGATGVTVGDMILVNASSSLPSALIIQAASSTAADTVSLILHNTGFAGGGTNSDAPTSSVILYNAADATNNFLGFDFWAFR